MSQPEQRRILATAIPGPKSLKLQAQRDAEVAGGLGTVLPVFVERAGGGILVDVDGNHIVDLASGIAVTSVGASDPAVVRRVSEQAQRFTHTCFMVTEYEGYVDVAAALNRLTPGTHAKRTALFTTGAEAVENAIKIARTATGRAAVVVLGHAYHGRTLLTMSMTAKNVPYKEGFGPFAPEIYRVPSPYPFRWPTGAENAGAEAFAALEDAILTQIGAHNVAAIVAEPIQGEGGFVVPPPGYLQAVQDFATRHGIVFVADEIQTGLARTGAMFACEHDGVVPDLITTAKALAGGMPLAAVTGRAELMDAVAPGDSAAPTPGTRSRAPLPSERWRPSSGRTWCSGPATSSERVMPRLGALVGPGSTVGEVRGRGAMLALEFVRPGTTEPAPEVARAVAARCHQEGVLTLVCGTYGNVIRLLPPLVISMELLDVGLDVLEAAVRDVG